MNDIKLLDPSDVKIINITKDTKDIDSTIKRPIRFIKLKEDIYYGPKNVNKNKFVRMYRSLGLTWRTENIEGTMVDGWFNKDKSQYIIKLLEENGYKRFKFYGCDNIYDYFMSLGAVTFDGNKEEITSSIYRQDINIESTEKYTFIGADLWAGYRTKQLLKDMPMNWGVIWK